MSHRESQVHWLKDVIEHLHESHEQLEWTSDPEATRLLLDSMMQDLECGRRLCADIRVRTSDRPALAMRR